MAFEVERTEMGIKFKADNMKQAKEIDSQTAEDMLQALITLKQYPKITRLRVENGWVTVMSTKVADLAELMKGGDA